jgi:ubiquinone/menaquinone biosynthesis C-methylase UbiE
MNYFSSPAIAERYAEARPDLSRLFNDELLRHTGSLRLVADFGCGTGLSSRALLAVGDDVVGLDPSLAMLRMAGPHPRVHYCAGVAEASPFSSRTFELLAAALALHWFDRDLFLAEAYRVLRPGGWLFIYNTWFRGTMEGRPEFATWSRDRYLARFPIPPRAGEPITARDGSLIGFTETARWDVEARVSMSPERLSRYLTTQSNVSAGLAREEESLDNATNWLEEQVAPYFRGAEEFFPFGGSAWLLRRDAG